MPYAGLDDITLFYREAGNRAAGDDGPPVLLIHELGGSGASWEAVMSHLAKRRRVLAPDLRNAGLSEKPPGPHELEHHADDLAGLLAARGIAQADIIGSALGAIVALTLALRHPAKVRRMVLCAAAPEITDDARRYLAERAERVRAEGMRTVAAATLANAFPSPHEAAGAAYLPAFLANAPHAYAELSLALSRMNIATERFAGIAAPTLILQGAADFIWPPAVGERVAGLLPAARFRLLADAAHFPHIQAPDMVAAIALEFCAR